MWYIVEDRAAANKEHDEDRGWIQLSWSGIRSTILRL